MYKFPWKIMLCGGLLLLLSISHIQGAIIEGPSNVTYLPNLTPLPIELTCNVTGTAAWRVNDTSYTIGRLTNGDLPGHSRTGTNILVNSPVNNTEYICVSTTNDGDVNSDPAYVIIAGIPEMVPDVDNTSNISGNTVTITLSWGEPFNNLDPIVNYTVSCSSDVPCPPIFITTNNTTRSYTITNLTPMTNYTFSVVATNSIGSGEAHVVTITTPFAIVAFSDSVYSFGEDVGLAQPVLVFSNTLSIEFNVIVFTTDETATGGSTIGEGVDYVSGPYTVTFPSGMTVLFNITIHDDAIMENHESFTLTINLSSLPTGVIVGSPDQAIVTIVDNDGGGSGSNPASLSNGIITATACVITFMVTLIAA